MRQIVASVIEVNDLLQALKVAIVRIRLDEVGTRPHIHVPQSRDLELPVKLRSELRPLGIWVETRISEKGTDSFVHKSEPGRVANESVLVRLILFVVRNRQVSRNANVCRSKVGK